MDLPEKKFEWDTPHDWLAQAGIDRNELMTLINLYVEGDQIQDHFQTEMDEDGYFIPTNLEDFIRLLDRDQIVKFYEDYGEYGMDDEELFSYEDLVDGLTDDIKNGLYSFDDIEEIIKGLD